MREFFKSTALFIFFAFAISGVSCGGGSSEPGANTGSSPSSGETTTAEAPKKSSEYPPVNSAVANADIKQLDGTTFKVADKKGKVVLLNMWATWCGPCRAEMPELVKLQDRYRDNGFEVIGLNTDDEPAAVMSEFSAQMKLNYNLVWADEKLQSELLKISKFGGIPQSFLVDRDGNLRGVFTGGSPATIAKLKEIVEKVVDGESTPVAAQPDANPAAPAMAPDSDHLAADGKTAAAKDAK